MRRALDITAQLEADELFGLLTEATKPKPPVAWIELESLDIAPSATSRSEAPDYGARERMRAHDSLPEAWRLLVHEFGLNVVARQWKRLRSKDAEKAKAAIEVERMMACIEKELPIF